MAEVYQISYIETSAKNNTNIKEMLDIILNLTYEFKFKNPTRSEPERNESIKLSADAQVAPPKKSSDKCKC